MPHRPTRYRVGFIQGAYNTLGARLVNPATGGLVEANGVNAISRTVKNLTSGEVVGTEAEDLSPVSDYVLSEEQTDGWDTRVSAGYNFRDSIPDTYFPDANAEMTVSYLVELADGTTLGILAAGKTIANQMA